MQLGRDLFDMGAAAARWFARITGKHTAELLSKLPVRLLKRRRSSYQRPAAGCRNDDCVPEHQP